MIIILTQTKFLHNAYISCLSLAFIHSSSCCSVCNKHQYWLMENRPRRSVTLLGGRSETSTLFGSDFYGYK